MKDYSRILTKVTSSPWMMEPSALRMLLEIIDAHMSGAISQEEIQVRMQTAAAHPGNGGRSGAVGVLPLYGPIFPRANMMTEFSGATSLEQFNHEFDTMMADDSISTIVLDIDSPGGLSDGGLEIASKIRAARDQKDIFSVANTAANSLAYMIASQATKMYASPSAQVGSIGTYLVHTDESGLEEKQGVKNTVIKAGRFKAALIESLTPESREMLQQFVNETNDGFVEAVSLGRGVSKEHVNTRFGEGGVLTAKSAAEVGMVDGVATFDEVVGHAAEQRATSVVQLYPGRKQSYDADKEHSEPGTGLGGEPTPREPPEEGDLAIENGWRRDSPPAAFETEENMREWLEARANALKIEFTAEMSDEDLATAVATRMDEVVVPLNEATQDVQAARQLAQDYPEVAERLAKLEADTRLNEARAFADSYQHITGTNHGLSTLCRDTVAEMHQKIGARTFNETDLKTLVDQLTTKAAMVPLGEAGSSRGGDEGDKPGVTGDFVQDRKQFAEIVRAAMSEDNLSREAAIEHVSKLYPELAQQYLTGHAR